MPALDEVINIRDVTFNENVFYNPAEEQTLALSTATTTRQVEALKLPDPYLFGDSEPLFGPVQRVNYWATTEEGEVIHDEIVVVTGIPPLVEQPAELEE